MEDDGHLSMSQHDIRTTGTANPSGVIQAVAEPSRNEICTRRNIKDTD